LVADLIRKRGVNEALDILRFTRKRASSMIEKVLRAAIAAADEHGDVDVDSLIVSDARVDGGPMRYGWLPRARGMATRIRHRTSHITVEVATPEELGMESEEGK